MEGVLTPRNHRELPLQDERKKRKDPENDTEWPRKDMLEDLLHNPRLRMLSAISKRPSSKEMKLLVERFLQSQFSENRNLDWDPSRCGKELLDIYLRNQKEEENKVPLEIKVQKLLKHNPELDKDVLYSKRYRKEVWSIVERMSHEPCDAVSSDDEISRELSLLADNQKILREYEDEYGSSWHHSICYPLAPNSIKDELCLPLELSAQVDDVLIPVLHGMWGGKCVNVESSSDMTDSEAHDVVSLLSLGDKQTLVCGGGERIVLNLDTFRSKYVLVCCISAPVLYGSFGFQSLLNLCNELSLERGDDVEMVMVARMNLLADTEKVFNHLFSGFPTSCLAVPYEDWERRERVWKLLYCGDWEFQCAIYDTNGLFLNSFCVDDVAFPYYGADGFPFTEEMVKKMDRERQQLRNGSLENLLRPYEYSPDVVVYERDGPDQKELPRLLSEVIKDKHVGLYLCCEGELIPLLHDLYEQCKLKDQKFEIVVVYLPLACMIDPGLFKEKIDKVLQKQKIRGWWYLPFNNSVSMRLCGLAKDYDCSGGIPTRIDMDMEDKLIMLGTDGKILDMYGSYVIRIHGIDTYPFTRAAVVEKKMGQLRDLRLESSLLVGQLFRGVDPDDVISADKLLSSKKKIIIVMAKPGECVVACIRYDIERLVSQYKNMKKKDGGAEFEVVFIEHPRKGDVPKVDPSKFVAMPWYIHRPLDGTYAPLAEKLKEIVMVQSLVGFGEDGHICSVKLPAELCLEENLFDDLYQLLHFNEFADI